MLRLGALLLLLVCALGLSRLSLRTSIADFLPRGDERSAIELARAMASSMPARTSVFVLEADGGEATQLAAGDFVDELEHSGLFEWVRAGFGNSEEQVFYEAFSPHALALTPVPTGGWTREALRARAESLKSGLASPLGAALARTGPKDPLRGFEAALHALREAHGGLDVDGGMLRSADGKGVVVMGVSRASSLDGSAQAEVEAVVQRAHERASAKGEVALWWTSVGRHSAAIEGATRRHVSLVSGISTLAIVVLYLLVFRSLRPVLAGGLPIFAGLVVALGGTQWIFGYVHALTLAFGAALIGVAIDYVTHYLVHSSGQGGGAPDRAAPTASEVIKDISPALVIGALTTCVGIATLAASGIPGLVQVAFFGSAGIFGALVATLFFLPFAAGRARRVVLPALPIVPDRLPWASLGLALLVSVGGLVLLEWDEGMDALREPTPALDAEAAVVQEKLGTSSERQHLILAVGPNEEAALEANDELARRLAALSPDLRYRSIHALLPSVATQRKRVELWREGALRKRFDQVFDETGFRTQLFAPFWAGVHAPFKPLTVTGLSEGPVRELVDRFRVEPGGGRVGYATYVDAWPPRLDVSALLAHESASGGYLREIDQRAVLSDGYRVLRSNALYMIGLGLIGVALILFVRYRRIEVAVRAMLPAVLACTASLGVQGLVGVHANLMHLVGMILVLSIGVDYGIYTLEAKSEGENEAARASISLATATTLASFTALALVPNPALRAIGLTVALGVPLAAWFSPMASLSFSRKKS